MVEYVNIIMRNEDVQGREETFGTWQAALEKAIYDAENRNMSWKEAKKHRVEIWIHETETDEMELYEIIPFVRKWKVEVNLNTDTWKEFEAYPETCKIKARNARDAASDVLTWMDMDDVPVGVQFKVYPVDDRGEKVWYEKAVIFDKGDLE